MTQIIQFPTAIPGTHEPRETQVTDTLSYWSWADGSLVLRYGGPDAPGETFLIDAEDVGALFRALGRVVQ